MRIYDMILEDFFLLLTWNPKELMTIFSMILEKTPCSLDETCFFTLKGRMKNWHFQPLNLCFQIHNFWPKEIMAEKSFKEIKTFFFITLYKLTIDKVNKEGSKDQISWPFQERTWKEFFSWRIIGFFLQRAYQNL